MKTLALTFARKLTTATLATACFFALPTASHAKDKDKGRSKHDKHEDKHHHDDHEHYSSRPRSSFTLSFGSGYAGRGYYYGPANSSYYYRQPGVTYYRSREAYYGPSASRGNSVDVAVQQALARRGYYYGRIDGDIGPASRRSIARYQDDCGLRVTGSINASLLDSLGID
jgi:hypothetical protein